MLIGKLAAESGFSRDTIRFYEKRGLLSVGEDHVLGNGYKNYPAQALDRLLHVRELKELGFTLTEISDLLSLVETKEEVCVGLPEKLDAKIETLERKMKTLARYKENLEAVRESCDGNCSARNGLPDCFSSNCC